MKSYTEKALEFTISLNGKTKTIRGLAASAKIVKNGLPDNNSATIKIYNMLYEDMAELTTLSFTPLAMRHNSIIVRAGEADAQNLPVVFSGNIAHAYADFSSVPDVAMHIEAQTGYYGQQIAEKPMSVQGKASIGDLVAGWAEKLGMSFKNEGVPQSVLNAVFNGSPLAKAKQAAAQVGAHLIVDDDMVTLLPANTPKQGSSVLLTPDTGLIGYPTFTQNGISLESIFNPHLQYFGTVQVESIVPKASGTWTITRLEHDLAAFDPEGGPWSSLIDGVNYAF